MRATCTHGKRGRSNQVFGETKVSNLISAFALCLRAVDGRYMFYVHVNDMLCTFYAFGTRYLKVRQCIVLNSMSKTVQETKKTSRICAANDFL